MNERSVKLHDMDVGIILRGLRLYEDSLKKDLKKKDNPHMASIAATIADIYEVRNLLAGRERFDDGEEDG